jgi:hypothetical protein
MRAMDGMDAQNTFAVDRLVLFNHSYQPIRGLDALKLRNMMMYNSKRIKTLVIKRYMTKQLWNLISTSEILKWEKEFDVEDVTWVGCNEATIQKDIVSALRWSIKHLNIGSI